VALIEEECVEYTDKEKPSGSGEVPRAVQLPDTEEHAGKDVAIRAGRGFVEMICPGEER
jgi:hypothetical protein